MSPKIDLYYQQQQQQQQQKHHQHQQHQHQIPKPCPHLADFQSRYGHKPFRALQKCLRVKPLGRAAIRRDPLEVPRCGTCGDSSRPRLYACVACASIFCHSVVTSSHAAAHALSSPGHEIAVDVDRAELFCCACCDQVYDRDFDASVVLAQTEATTLGGGSSSSSSSSSSVLAAAAAAAASPENLRKRRRVVDYRPWTPDFEEQMMMGNGSSPMQTSVGVVGVSSNYLPWGLRGLNNLGNTCFMNSVLQALLHTPPLRNYFLSDRHNQYICQTNKNHIVSSTTNADTKMKKDNSNNSRLCMGCDMDAMFSAVFSGGDRRPYSPAKLLYSWWQHASNLASYEQQDAHEFFISVLDGIHEKVEKDKRKPQSQGNGDCCIAHRVFSGLLRSDVTCMACGFTSTTYDPCVDISLDLEPNHGGSMKKASTKSHHVCTVESDSKTTQNPGISTLVGCLDRFTRPEKLGSDQKFFCQQCQVRQESLKQMSIRKLPLVSCFHIKRFEHSSTRKMSRKVDRYLQFPFSLDMSPYLSSSILTSRFGNRLFTYGSEPDPSNELSSEFELFAVVTHTGGLDAGHYVTYLRLNDQWYKCDDAWITQVNESIVRAAQGYMMFYVQKILYYKASESLAAS